MKELISPAEIRRKIDEVAHTLESAYHGQEIAIVMIMKGAICLVADLIRVLKNPTSLDFIQAASYRGSERGDLQIFGLERCHVEGKDVLLIDDIYDSGVTLSTVANALMAKHPKSLKTLVLLSKKAPRTIPFNPDYVLFEIDNLFVVGYGLDYKERYRGLPGIYQMG